MNVIDHYYDKISNVELSTQQLMDILEQLGRLNQLGKNQKNLFQLYVKISEAKNCNDEIIKKMVNRNISPSLNGYPNGTHKILNNGSKQLFDEIWLNGIGPYKNTKYWKCKHADAKQLEEIHKEKFAKKPDSSSTHYAWIIEERKDFLRHPNTPEKILSRVGYMKDVDTLIIIAANPNLISKKKVFDQICMVAKERSKFVSSYDKLLEALLTNKSLDWKTVADGIDLKGQLEDAFSEKVFTTNKRRVVLIDFCERDECPEEIRLIVYNATGKEEFLPKTVKAVFVF